MRAVHAACLVPVLAAATPDLPNATATVKISSSGTSVFAANQAGTKLPASLSALGPFGAVVPCGR